MMVVTTRMLCFHIAWAIYLSWEATHLWSVRPLRLDEHLVRLHSELRVNLKFAVVLSFS